MSSFITGGSQCCGLAIRRPSAESPRWLPTNCQETAQPVDVRKPFGIRNQFPDFTILRNSAANAWRTAHYIYSEKIALWRIRAELRSFVSDFVRKLQPTFCRAPVSAIL